MLSVKLRPVVDPGDGKFYPPSSMKYHNVYLESFGYVLPDEIVSSDDLESQLAPLYKRLRLPAGRLELMTGIHARRLWSPGTLPSVNSIAAGNLAVEAADFDRSHIGAMVHGSVCRDHLEPATAAGVHHGLELPRECVIYDVSNACLGILNGIVQVANMIELGQIRAGLVVGSEGSRQLVETTVDALNRDESLTRKQIKSAVASLTIGSAAAGVLLCNEELTQSGNRLIGAVAQANTAHHQLCHSGQDEAVADGMSPLMNTDSERLMHEGIATGESTFAQFLDELGWTRETINRTVCHQVGAGHRKLMCETLGIQPATDYTTFQWLGNTGSAACPVSLALAAEQGHLKANENVALLGIGSGINCLMLGVQWQKACVKGSGGKAEPVGFDH